MVDPIQQHHEPIARLQAQLAVLKQENLELKSRLQSCESQAKLQLDDRTSTREHRLLEATAEVANALLTIAHLDEAVNTALQIIGEALDTDRVNVIENFAHPIDSFPYWRVLYEWDSPGTVPQFSDSNAAQGSYEEILWLHELFQQSRTASYLIEEVPEPFRSEQMAIGVKSTHLVAIQVEGKWWGVLGLDDCRAAKRRSAAELAVLRIAADCIGSAIQRQRIQQASLEAEQARTRSAAERSAELQQTLDRLAESEQRYRTLFELSNEGIYRFEFEPPVPTSLPIEEQLDLVLQHYRYVEANETFCAQMGLSIDQLQAYTLSDFHGDLEANRQVNRSILANGYQIRNAETDELDALGRRKSFLNNIVCDVRDGYLWGGWCTQTDVTELRETQQALLQAAQERAIDLAKANEALQATIDAMAQIDDLDEFVPAVLQIVAQTFQAKDCAFYEVGVEGTVYLRYWLFENRVFCPDELLALDGNRFATIRRLAGGFSVPDTYLGTPVRERTRAVIIDHLAGTSEPDFDEFTRNNNWHMELNVPLVVDDCPDGALVIYRPAGESFTPAEVTLAGSLGKQLALAMQANRLATESKLKAVETAIAREQEKAAQERSAELERANNALQSTVAALASRRDLEGFIGEVLHTIAREFDSPLVEYWITLGTDTVEVHTWLCNNQLLSLKQNDPHPGRGGIRLLPEYTGYEDFSRRSKLFTFNEPMPAYSLALGQVICPIEWYAERGVSRHFNFPLQAGDTTIGAISVWLPVDRQITEDCLRLGQALSHQTALAIQLTQLAEEAKQAAVAKLNEVIAREQEKAALERAAELAKANEALARASSRLADQPDLSAFLGHIMLEAVDQLGADGGHLTIYDKQRQVITTAVLIEQGSVVPTPDFPPEMPIAEVGFIQLIRETRRLRYFDLEANFEQDAHLLWTQVGEHHKRQNHVVGIAIPLLVGDKFLGHLGLAFSYKKLINEQSTELLQALANQAALAIQLTRLAEEAKQAAIAREQEKAAQERAAELAKANAVLRGATDRLANEPSLEAFLGHILTEACHEAIESGLIALYDEDQEQLLPVVGYGFSAAYPYSVQQPIPIAKFPTWSTLLQTKQPLVVDMNEQPELFVEETLAWHRAQGHQGIVVTALMLGDRPLGVFGIASCSKVSFKETELELFQALAQQATLAIQLTQLAEKAKQAAIAREQEKAAQERAAELARSNEALQQTIDTLGSLSSFDEFIPAVLKIVAQTFNATDCGFYEHSQDETVYLRYWFSQGTVLNPTELQLLDPQQHPVLLQIINGFTVPPEHLHGTTVRDRTRPVIINHTTANTVPEFHAFAVSQGWELELNQPLLADGKAAGALIIYRRLNQPFTESEITLAEALAKQLALAMQASRLSDQARDRAVETAIAREQEKVAQERAILLERVTFVLQRSTERLSAAADPKAVIVETLRTSAEMLAPLGVNGIGLMSYQPANRTVRVMVHIIDGVEQTIAGSDLDGDWSVDSPTMVVPWKRIQSENFVWGLTTDAEVLVPEVRHYHESRGAHAVAYVPLRRGEETVGWIGFALTSETPPTQQQIEMIQALTSQVLLAVEMERLSEAVRKAAVAREQEKAAQERAAELERINLALSRSLQRLANKRDIGHFLEDLLVVLSETFEASLAMLFTFDLSQKTATIVAAVDHNKPYVDSKSPDPYPEVGCEPVNISPIIDKFTRNREIWFLNTCESIDFTPESEVIEWHRRKGHKEAVAVPLFAGDSLIGLLGFAFDEKTNLTPFEIEFVNSLAAQATLALQLILLAEEAKQAAIAREQEKATQEQAAELVKANEALRRSIAHLTSADHLQSFLMSALKEAIQASRADSGAVFVYQAATDTLQMTVLVLNGEPVDIATDPRAAIWRSPVPTDLTSAWHMIQQQQIVWLDLNQPSPEAWQFAIPWHQAQGHKTIPMIPLTLGEQLLGFMGLAFTTDQSPNQSRFEQCRTFAHHAALALQMADLVQQTKQTALLEERNRMAREIHDTLAQSFTSIGMQLEAATRFLARKPEQAHSCLSFAQELARSGLAEARRSVWALQSEAEDYRHLVSTLQRLAAQRSTECAVQVEVAVVGTVYTLPADVGMNLLRIGQEALNNAIRHANAQIILLTLTYDSDQIQLQVQDDGQGFDPELQRNSGGFGLMGMQQRSDRLGGAFAITSQLGKGTEVKVTVPIIQKEN